MLMWLSGAVRDGHGDTQSDAGGPGARGRRARAQLGARARFRVPVGARGRGSRVRAHSKTISAVALSPLSFSKMRAVHAYSYYLVMRTYGYSLTQGEP
jgi:hypothetical protein